MGQCLGAGRGAGGPGPPRLRAFELPVSQPLCTRSLVLALVWTNATRNPSRDIDFVHAWRCLDSDGPGICDCRARLWQPEELPRLHNIDLDMDPADFQWQ